MPLVGDHSGSRRFAFALISPPAASPGFVLRRALEEVGGNPHFGLAASHYGAMMILFPSQEVRETTMALFPVSFLGHTSSLERPEVAENRFGWRYAGYAQISASGFPLEYWTEGGIRNAFRPIGNVCCIDPLCLNELDYSAVRLVLHVENEMDIPPKLLLRDYEGETSTEVSIRVVRYWAHDAHGEHFAGGGGNTPRGPGGSPPASGGGSGGGSNGPSSPSHIASPGRRGGLDDIDSCSMGSVGSGSGAALDLAASPGYVRPSHVSTALDLWMRVLVRRGPVAHAPCVAWLLSSPRMGSMPTRFSLTLS
jgi:hypothetical protein